MRIIAAAMLCMIAAPAWADSDPWGDHYPAECADLSPYSVKSVVDVNHLPVTHGTPDRCGHWKRVGNASFIYLLKSCDKPRTEVLRHEMTHECRFQLTGDPRWH